MIAPRHADFVLQATSSLNEPVLEGWKRLFFIFLIVAISITILPYIFTEERYEVEAVVLNKWITGDEFSPLYHVAIGISIIVSKSIHLIASHAQKFMMSKTGKRCDSQLPLRAIPTCNTQRTLFL